MKTPPRVDRAFNDWLVQRSLSDQKTRQIEKSSFSIAIESPCLVCQPRVARDLAVYLNEFDDESNGDSWMSVTDHHLEQLQAYQEFRKMLGHDKADDPDSAIDHLSAQGGVILQLPKCHAQTAINKRVFQVSMSCHEPKESNHHLWVNAKRIPQETLIPMIANSFLDWASNGGDRNDEQ
ncbi:hypothetical protein N9A86_01285 [Akkermansiaceae bacterium]|nr:hypothetical protein [Akkermansiaceae bacterium]